MMKFLADMGISQRTVEYLRETNFDAIHLREQGLQKLQDPIILQKAKAEGRILLTHDLDFSDLMAASGNSMPSVIVFRLKSMKADNVNRHLAAIIETVGSQLTEGVIISVNEQRIRVRKLPI